MKKFIDLCANSLGFSDVQDLITSIFVLKSSVLTLAVILLSAWTSFIMYLENYVFTPVFSFVLYMVLIASETASGTLVSLRVNKEKFDLDKGFRFPAKLLAQTALLTLAFNMGKSSDFYLWLPNFIFITITGLNFLKTARNLGRLNWIEGEIVEFIEKKFSAKNGTSNDSK